MPISSGANWNICATCSARYGSRIRQQWRCRLRHRITTNRTNSKTPSHLVRRTLGLISDRLVQVMSLSSKAAPLVLNQLAQHLGPQPLELRSDASRVDKGGIGASP